MESNLDNMQDTTPSDPDASDKNMTKTLLLQGVVLGGIVVLLVTVSFFGLI